MIPSVEELEKLKVVELRARLSKFGISTSGRKAELIAKLQSYYEENEDSSSQDPNLAPPGIPPTPAQMLQAEQGRHMSDMPPVPPPPPLPPQQFLAQEEMIEREKQRIFQQQQQLIQKRQEEQQRLEAEKMQKALQQQQMLAAEKMLEQGMGGPPPPPPGAPPGPPPPKLDDMMQEKVMQQQHMIEQQQTERIGESSNIPDSDARDDEELLRHQQLAIQEITKQSLPPNVPLPPPPPVPFPPQAPGVPPLSAPVPPPPPLLPPAPQPSNLPQASQSAPMPPPLLQPATSQAPPPSSMPQGMSLPVPPPPPPPGLLLASQPPTSEPPPPAPPVDRTPGGPPPIGPPPPGPLPLSMPQDDQRERPPHMDRGPPPLHFEGPRSRMQPPFDNRGPPRPFFGGNFRGGPPQPPPFSGPPGPPPVSQPPFNSRPNFNMPPPGQQTFRERGPPPLMGNRGPPPPGSYDMRDRPPPRQPVENRSGRRDGPPGGPSGPGPESQRRTPVSQSSESETKEPAPLEIKLPMALEKVLAYKEERAQEVGVTEEEAVGLPAATEEDSAPTEMESIVPEADEDEGYDEEEEEEEPESNKSKKERIERKQKLTKNQRRKLKKKRRKEAKRKNQEQKSEEAVQESTESMEEESAYPPGVEIEYVAEKLEITEPSMRQFSRIFEAFRLSEELKPQEKAEPMVEERAEKKREEKKDSGVDAEDSDEEDLEPESDVPKLSKKKLRKMNRLSVAELKQLVNRPDVVEMHDVTARDPKLLVYLKAYRNTVPVPRHWCFKRKYLQGKRGIIKPPFELPDFIKKTGIMEMRQALQEKEEQQTMKTKMRQRVRPKMGKIDIDYQKLHDAFFRWQTKPKLTMHGELYYEGKEFETKLKEKKPGELTDELRTALGMPTGENADKYPPPWLIAMQRYGPPPSYPHLKIPGLNSPIPEGCTFGYHAGGWGKPPVDELGKPLYGDVFGTNADDFQKEQEEEEIDRTAWGELESESEEESDEEESEEEEDEDGKEIDETGLITPAEGGLITPSGLSSIATGMETPEMIELRKQNIEDAMEQGGDTPALYTVLPEKKAAVGGAMMGSAHVYDIGAATAGKKTGASGITEGVAVALDPSELDLDTAAMAAKYEEQVREQQSQLEKEDFSDMVAEHAAKQKNKRKKQSQDSGRQAKKYKEFKF